VAAKVLPPENIATPVIQTTNEAAFPSSTAAPSDHAAYNVRFGTFPPSIMAVKRVLLLSDNFSQAPPTSSATNSALASFKGEPAVSFSDEDIAIMDAPLRLALIGKFSHGKPCIKDIRKAVDSIGLVGFRTTGVIDKKHILMRFSRKEDFQRIWIK
jgi:hypothetical protein